MISDFKASSETGQAGPIHVTALPKGGLRPATTLLENSMETQKGPYKANSLSKMGLYMGFDVSLGECIAVAIHPS